MAYVAVDEIGTEAIFEEVPERFENYWIFTSDSWFINLPKGLIAKLIGRELTWEDEPVELK